MKRLCWRCSAALNLASNNVRPEVPVSCKVPDMKVRSLMGADKRASVLARISEGQMGGGSFRSPSAMPKVRGRALLKAKACAAACGVTGTTILSFSALPFGFTKVERVGSKPQAESSQARDTQHRSIRMTTVDRMITVRFSSSILCRVESITEEAQVALRVAAVDLMPEASLSCTVWATDVRCESAAATRIRPTCRKVTSS
mmetsp:Transcript_50995/g.110655  ORF Transcript_50995/g.110655 Transcript_50995/m.110655 type:complete len:201 (-) Transcript_50995:223-825(-)